MNYIKEAENVLLYYNDLYRSIQNMDREIAKLVAKQGPSVLTAVAGDETGIRGGGGHEDTANVLFRLQILTENKLKTEAELEKINCQLNEISQDRGCELYGQVLKEWYVFKTPKEEIRKTIGYSERKSIYNLRDKAIRKFSASYYGIEAVRAM
jgi:hypothetical protein